jgi:hypothetical protein
MPKQIVIGVLIACISHGQAAAEESLDRVFNFTHTGALQDRQEITTVVRSISEMRDVSIDAAHTALTLRGTPRQASIAEWLFKKLDIDTEPQAAAATNEFRPSSDDDAVRVFYLKHTGTPQDLQEISTVVRSMTEVRKLFTYASQRGITLRGTTAQMEFAGWLFKELDKPPNQPAVTQQSPNSAPSEFPLFNGNEVARVFYLTHTDTPQALHEIASQVRSIAEIRRAFVINSQKAVAMRGTVAQIALADSLFRELDK